MTSLGDTIAALSARRKLFTGEAVFGRMAPAAPGRLSPLVGFEPNPGALGAHCYLPKRLTPGAALVVVLHGCTQTAANYDAGSGWSRLADREGFALLFPEQSRANNHNLCFNWFQPGDVARDAGEAASIHAMVTQMIAAHGLDPARVFVTGLSAGGAMTVSLLACYPETFAAGAVIAGLPHGAAGNVPQAFEAMRGKRLSDAALRKGLTAAAAHKGPWPRLSIWHGTADSVVAPANAEALLQQWRGVHKAGAVPDKRETIDGAERRSWRGRDSRTTLEVWSLPGMGHGAPVAPAKDKLGKAMPFMLAQEVSSTARIAGFFGLLDGKASAKAAPRRRARKPPKAMAPLTVPPQAEPIPGPSPVVALGNVLDKALPDSRRINVSIKGIIDSALRRAGLR
jgi:poly(hydroxyalkanoate) depolymerase family esterase